MHQKYLNTQFSSISCTVVGGGVPFISAETMTTVSLCYRSPANNSDMDNYDDAFLRQATKRTSRVVVHVSIIDVCL